VEVSVKVKRALAIALAASLIAGPAAAQESTRARFTAIMDNVFGSGAWRITGGFRTPEREDQLRRQGAMTVREGGLSRHSLGTPDAPGAYDIVVNGMSPYEAANRLQRAGAPFARYMPKGAHGSEGPHLHLEPYSFDLQATGGTPIFQQASYSRPSSSRRSRVSWDTGPLVVVEGIGRRRDVPDADPPSFKRSAGAPATADNAGEGGDEVAQLRKAALRDSPEAQLKLARALLSGKGGRGDAKTALRWLEMAASNPKADQQTRDAAAAALEEQTGPQDYAGR
jgi:hypothetical protein